MDFGEGLFEAVDGSVSDIGPVAVVHLSGEGVDGSLRRQGEFVLVVEGGAVVLFFVEFGGLAGCSEVCIALIEFALEIGALVRCQGEGSGRRVVRYGLFGEREQRRVERV